MGVGELVAEGELEGAGLLDLVSEGDIEDNAELGGVEGEIVGLLALIDQLASAVLVSDFGAV